MVTIELTPDQYTVVREALLRERNRNLQNSQSASFKLQARQKFLRRANTLESVVFDSMPRASEVTS